MLISVNVRNGRTSTLAIGWKLDLDGTEKADTHGPLVNIRRAVSGPVRWMAFGLGVMSAGTMAYLVLSPAFVDLQTYTPAQTAGTVLTSTSQGVPLLRLTDANGEQRRFVCDTRGRSGRCLLPALNAGLRDGAVATVTHLRPPPSGAMAEPIILQITVDGREYLDCSQRLQELRLVETGGPELLCPMDLREGASSGLSLSRNITS